MALTQDEKLQCYNLCVAAVGQMSSAEYLRATIAQSSAYAAATDPVAVVATIISEIQAFRDAHADPSDYVSDPPGFGTTYVTEAQLAAKLG